MDYNGNNTFSHANGLRTYQFKTKYPKIDTDPLRLGHISIHFTYNGFKKLDFMDI